MNCQPSCYQAETVQPATPGCGCQPAPTKNATTATGGQPGYFNGTPPDDFGLLANVKPRPSKGWGQGNYVVLGDGSHAYWDGLTWKVGESPGPATVANRGSPGTFNGNPAANLSNLKGMTASPSSIWPPGTYVELADGTKAYWDGSEYGWKAGVAPAYATIGYAGKPGKWGPAPGRVPIGVYGAWNASGIVASPSTDWMAGQYIVGRSGGEGYWWGGKWWSGRAYPANPGTEVTAGSPGKFNGYPPETLAALQASGITPSPATAWTTGQFIWLRGHTQAYWNGTAWVAGVAP